MHDRVPRPASPLSRRGLLAGAAGSGVLALGASALLAPGVARAETTITENQSGTHGGYSYSFWTDGAGDVAMTLTDGGGYRTAWTDAGSWSAGKGWSTGDRRTVRYTGDFRPSGDGFLCLHGWTTNPLAEYFVIESYGSYRPLGEHRGTVTTDGATYDIQLTMRYNHVSVEGVATYPQFWSVNQSTRSTGAITTGAHFDAWADAGMRLGAPVYPMILATEGYRSSGTSALTLT